MSGAKWRQDWLPIQVNCTHALDGNVGVIKQFVTGIRTRKQASPNATGERKALEVIYDFPRQLGMRAVWKYVASYY